MHTLRALAVATTAAGVITGLPLSHALACDNDRFPCPIVSDAPETTEAPAKAAPGAPARKKATNQAAPRQDERAATHQDEKARPKSEREAATRAPSRAKAAKPEKQEQPVDSGRSCAAAVTPAPVEVRADRKLRRPPCGLADCARHRRWRPGRCRRRAPAAPALATGVATVDPNEVNELDLAAPLRHPAPAESSWIKYLLATLGAALAAASTVRFLFV